MLVRGRDPFELYASGTLLVNHARSRASSGATGSYVSSEKKGSSRLAVESVSSPGSSEKSNAVTAELHLHAPFSPYAPLAS